jgi:hypothetical protein
MVFTGLARKILVLGNLQKEQGLIQVFIAFRLKRIGYFSDFNGTESVFAIIAFRHKQEYWYSYSTGQNQFGFLLSSLFTA